jgi:peptidoglycan LD-endopeptidase CwlK
MASRNLNDAHIILAEAYTKAEKEFEKLNPDSNVFVTCTYRSKVEQNELYAIGRTVKGKKVTNAQAGQSPHNYMPALAFDIAFLNLKKELDWSEKNFTAFAEIIKKIEPKIQWGGDFKSIPDKPHFELKEWRGYL